VTRWDWKNPENRFDGFFVLDIGTNSITESFNVSMADDYSGCYYYANMAPRTLVFDGVATFIKSHSYRRYDLDPTALLSTHEMDFFLSDGDKDCMPYFYRRGLIDF